MSDESLKQSAESVAREDASKAENPIFKSQEAPYGVYCPKCGAPSIEREKKPGGNDKCSGNPQHTYPTSSALAVPIHPFPGPQPVPSVQPYPDSPYMPPRPVLPNPALKVRHGYTALVRQVLDGMSVGQPWFCFQTLTRIEKVAEKQVAFTSMLYNLEPQEANAILSRSGFTSIDDLLSKARTYAEAAGYEVL